MRYATMHLSKSFDTGSDLYPIYSPTSPPSSPRSLYQRQRPIRRRKNASESIANDLFRRSFRPPLSPDFADGRMFAMPEEGTSSSPDEDPYRPQSTRSMGPGYHLLSAKDRLKSASLEWTMSNGSVTPKVTHYHTHPPLDFKSLKEKLEQLTGSRDDVNMKHVTGSRDDVNKKHASGVYERRKGVLSTLPVTTTGSNSAGQEPSLIYAAGKTDAERLERRAAGVRLLQSVPYVTMEPLMTTTTTTPDEVDSKPILRMNSIKQSENKSHGESSDTVQWSDLAKHVARKDWRLQKILTRHFQELENLKKHHELQWKELRRRISESTTGDHHHHQRNEAQLQLEQRCENDEGRNHSSLLSSCDVVDSIHRPTGVHDSTQITANSFDNSVSVVAQPNTIRADDVERSGKWRENVQCVDSSGNMGGTHGVAQQLPIQVRKQVVTPSMQVPLRQTDNQAYHQLDPNIWRDLVDRTKKQYKIQPVLSQQVEPLNWFQQLEMVQRLQEAGSVEQRMRQLVLQHNMSLLEAKRQTQSLNRFSNHCEKPFIQETSYSAEPYTCVNLNGSGISYSPNYTHVPQFFPQPSAFQQSPCHEVSSYYCPETLALTSNSLCCSPNQMACLLEAARNHLLPTSPVTRTPPQIPLLSQLISRQSPLCLNQSSLRSSPLQGLSLLSPTFQYSNTYPMVPDIRQVFFPLNPFST